MNVPQNLYLSNQSFNSDFVEFVWQFPYGEDVQDQVIFKVSKSGNIYLEFGQIGKSGDYINTSNMPTFHVGGVNFEFLKAFKSKTESEPLRKFFTIDGELVSLSKEVMEYLK